MDAQSPYLHLIKCLERDELATASKKLHFLLCEVAWQSPSDFMRAFGLEMKQIKNSYWDRMSEESQRAFVTASQMILKKYPQLER